MKLGMGTRPWAGLDIGTHSVNVSLMKNMPFHPERDFAPVTLLATLPNILAVNPSVPARTLKELVAYAKANPGKLSYASAGTGTASHITGEHFRHTAGVDVVFADPAGSAAGDVVRDGRHSASGTYTVSTIAAAVGKSVTVIDQFGGSQPVAGATLRYTITVTMSGSGVANGVVITDPFPANTTYTAGSLRLNGAPLSDAADADAGDAGITAPGAATVNLGVLTAASPVQTIVFDVKIN